MTDRETPAGAVEALDALSKAFGIGATSFDGDSWYASAAENGGEGYEATEAAMEAGHAALKQLRVDVERWQRIETAARNREKAEEVWAEANEAYNTSSRPAFTRQFLQLDRLETERAEAILALRDALVEG